MKIKDYPINTVSGIEARCMALRKLKIETSERLSTYKAALTYDHARYLKKDVLAIIDARLDYWEKELMAVIRNEAVNYVDELFYNFEVDEEGIEECRMK